MNRAEEVIDILKSVGALLLGDHFVGTSGKHLEGYVNKDKLFPFTELTSKICNYFAEAHKDLPIDVVAGPAMGGIILSQWTAHHLTQMLEKQIPSVYAEKKEGVLTFTRGYDVNVEGKNVLVVEDLTTTGGSLKKVIDLVKDAGGNPIAASVMINKSPNTVLANTFGLPFTALAELNIQSYDPEDCNLCQNNVPINTSLGHGKKFLENK